MSSPEASSSEMVVMSWVEICCCCCRRRRALVTAVSWNRPRRSSPRPVIRLGVKDTRATALLPAHLVSERPVRGASGVGASLLGSGVWGVPSEKISDSREGVFHEYLGVVNDGVLNMGCGGGGRTGCGVRGA